jgi:hypothetical protein
MYRSARLVVTALTVIVAACSSSNGTPNGTPSGASTSPVGSTPVPSMDPAAQTYWLRATFTQALPPLNRFGGQSYAVITGDGQSVTQLALPTVYPGPLLPNLVARQVTEAGRTAILKSARDLGLLNGTSDFNTGPLLAGGVSGRIELTVDGKRVTITGNPNALMECVTTPCEPPPGSAAAFAEFWRELGDLPSWIPNEMSPESAYVAPAYAILVGPAPEQDPNFTQPPLDWPLAQPLALFGGPVANGSYRCGTVSGTDADTLLPSLQAANQLTQWVQGPKTNATFGLTVRPMVPGEDICREAFGPA